MTPSAAPAGTQLLVHPLSRPMARGDGGSLRHREIPGWGVQEATGAIADANLLLVVDRLVWASGEACWAGAGVPQAAPRGEASDGVCYGGTFRDPPALHRRLAEAGRIVDAPLDALTVPEDWLHEMGGCCLDAVSCWLAAERHSAAAWNEQEGIAEALHGHGPLRGMPWRDVLCDAGLSVARHTFRNRVQTLEVLSTLTAWGVENEEDRQIAVDVLGADPRHIHANLWVAARTGTIAHDWSDLEALYLCYSEPDAPAWLEVTLPVLAGSEADRVGDLLASDDCTHARELLVHGLREGPRASADVTAAAMRAAPVPLRVPGLRRRLTFRRLPDCLSARLPEPGASLLAISRWEREAGPG